MRYLRIPLALLVATALMAVTTATVAAHNAGCVKTGTGEYVFVGSNKESPAVPEQNPRSSDDDPNGDDGDEREGTYLDLQPESPGSDQYGARFAADQGDSAVERPVTSPTDQRDCEPSGPRADNS